MNESKLRFKTNPHLEKLNRIMNAGSNTNTPSFMYLLPDQTAWAWMVLSLIATPYILWLLFKLRRYGWLISFTLFVALPFLIDYSFIDDDILRLILSYFPLINLGVFHFLLKQTYMTWKDPIFNTTPGSDFTNTDQ